MESYEKFLSERISDKPVCSDERMYQTEDGKLEVVYFDQMTFCNVRYNRCSLEFDLFVVSNKKRYVINADGNRGPMQDDISGVSLFGYELAKRQSTGDVTGIMRVLSSTGSNLPADAVVSGVYDVRLCEDEFSWEESQMLYRDQPRRDGTHKPIAFSSHNRLYFEEGKLWYEHKATHYNVNPKTMDRQPSKGSLSPFVAKER